MDENMSFIKELIRIDDVYAAEYFCGRNLRGILDQKRETEKPDVSIVQRESVEFCVKENNHELPKQRFFAKIGNAHIEGFFKQGTSKRLYVIFDGSRTRNGGKDLAKLPTFSRWSWAFSSQASFVCLEDPMYYTFEKCKLGWFYGTNEEDYIEDCAQCIKKIASLLGFENQDIVLYGASGGGDSSNRHISLFKRLLCGCS